LESTKLIDNIYNYYLDYNFIVNPLDNINAIVEIKSIMEKINATRMEGAYTFLLSVLKAFKENELKQNEVIELFHETLVLMVRRKYGDLRTTKYDTIFPSLLKSLIGERDKIDAFHKIIRKEEYWVSDDEFAEWIIERPLYRIRDLAFANLILQDLDRKMQKYDQYPDYTTLNTIEHILPQTLSNEWSVYLGSESRNEDLKRYVDTIGNLTLLSQPANSHAGQDPFLSKIADYTKITALNMDIENRKDKKWNIQTIWERSNYFKDILLDLYKWKK
jgi:hypothetical protein